MKIDLEQLGEPATVSQAASTPDPGAGPGPGPGAGPGPGPGHVAELIRRARYRWAAQLATGRDVLDTGDGGPADAGLLSAAGAKTVTRLEDRDLSRLPYDDASFDLITCFELLERPEESPALLDELRRVLRPGGVLLVSASRFSGLGDALEARLANVQLVRQAHYSLSVVSGSGGTAADAQTIDAVRLDELESDEPPEDPVILAIASDASLPLLAPSAVLAQAAELADLARLLLAAEQRLADVPSLKLQIADLEREVAEGHRTSERLSRELAALDDRLMDNQRTLVSVTSSPSWKLTRPLRVGKRLLRG